MIPGFENGFDGQRPHYEVWFGKVDVEPERALWFRYTLFAGAVDEASTWAIVFDGDDLTGGRSYWELGELEAPNVVLVPEGRRPERFMGRRHVFHAPGDPPAHLDEGNAIGEADGIEWDLEWRDSGRRFRYVPDVVYERTPVSSRYDTVFLDVDMSGRIETEDTVWEVENRPGMIGHIQGSKIAPERWAWSHCNNFDEDDSAVFEGLTARLGLMGRQLPAVSAFVVYVEGRRYTFRTPWSIVSADSTFDRNRWSFEVYSGGARLAGRAEMPDPERVALVEYDDTDGSDLWCYNSKLADVTIELDAPDLNGKRILRSVGTSAYEYMTREAPEGEPLV